MPKQNSVDPVVGDPEIFPESISAPPPPTPFSPENLRLSQDFTEMMPVKKVLTTVPVRRPNQQEWVRVHPSKEFRQNVAVINIKDDGEFYIVPATLVPELFGEIHYVTLYLTINRQGVIMLWPVRMPDEAGKDNPWWKSAREAAGLGMREWVRIRPDFSLGAYQPWTPAKRKPEGGTPEPVVLPEPEWPEDLGFWDIVAIAFKDKLISSLDHPVVKQLRGLA